MRGEREIERTKELFHFWDSTMWWFLHTVMSAKVWNRYLICPVTSNYRLIKLFYSSCYILFFTPLIGPASVFLLPCAIIVFSQAFNFHRFCIVIIAVRAWMINNQGAQCLVKKPQITLLRAVFSSLCVNFFPAKKLWFSPESKWAYIEKELVLKYFLTGNLQAPRKAICLS